MAAISKMREVTKKKWKLFKQRKEKERKKEKKREREGEGGRVLFCILSRNPFKNPLTYSYGPISMQDPWLRLNK